MPPPLSPSSPLLTDLGGEVKLMRGCCCGLCPRGDVGRGAFAEMPRGLTGTGGGWFGRWGDIEAEPGEEDEEGGPAKTNESKSSRILDCCFGEAGAELDAAVSASSEEKVREVLGEGSDGLDGGVLEDAAAACSSALTRSRIDMSLEVASRLGEQRAGLQVKG